MIGCCSTVQLFEKVVSYFVVFDLKVECVANALEEERPIFDMRIVEASRALTQTLQKLLNLSSPTDAAKNHRKAVNAWQL